jgi:hypothetical protein
MISNSAVLNPTNDNFEKAKKIMSLRPMMPFFSIPETIIGSMNIIPWIILLIIVTIIIII